jgi:predicted Zn-dependent peptidase
LEFAQARVDGGIPVFWTESGDEMTAGLVFRAGRADEILARGGITHLIEHLALSPLGAGARMDYNGTVDAVTTTFVTRGTPAEVAGFFSAVCASLRDLPIERLEAERQVLRTEAGRRQLGISDPLLIERYGADTYGLMAYPEFGVAALQADEVRAWAGKYFTRGNAAMWIAGGPPPGGLKLDLPDGHAMPTPTPARSESRTPGWVNAPVQGVGWSGLVRRSTPAQVYASVLNRRLLQALRHNRGLAYSPGVRYVIRDQDMAHVIAVADGLEEVHSALVQAFISELERVEATAITEDELLSTIDALRTAADTTRGAAARVAGAARNAVMGRPVESISSWREGLAAVSAADVQKVATEAFGSSLFVLPPKGRPYRAGFTALGRSSGTAVAGRQVRSADYPLDRACLVIGEDGVSLVRGQAVDTVRYAQCAALLKWPDGGRVLIGRDAVSIRIEPTLWRLTKLTNQTAHLEEKVGAERSVSMPIRPAEDVPRPWTRTPTRIAGWILAGPTSSFLAGTVPVTMLLALVALLIHGDGGVFLIVLVAPAMAAGATTARNARARLLRHAARRNARRR